MPGKDRTQLKLTLDDLLLIEEGLYYLKDDVPAQASVAEIERLLSKITNRIDHCSVRTG